MVDWLKKIHLNFSDMAHDSAADADCFHAALKTAGFDAELSYRQLLRWYEVIREANYDITVTLLKADGRCGGRRKRPASLWPCRRSRQYNGDHAPFER